MIASITDALTFFERSFETGRSVLGPSARSLFHILITFEIVFSGIYLALGESVGLKNAAKKILLIGFLGWIINNYTEVLQAVLHGFLTAGQQAVGVTSLDLATLQDPDKILQHGLAALTPVAQKLYQLGFGVFSIDGLLTLTVLLASAICYGLIAIQVFITYLEFLLISAVGFILIPFGIFKPLAFLSERVFGGIVMFGIKLMVLALTVTLSDAFIQGLVIPPAVTWAQLIQLLIVSLALAFLSFHAPAIAVSLFSGAPQFSIGAAAGVTAGATKVASAVAAGAIRSVGGAYGAVASLSAANASRAPGGSSTANQSQGSAIRRSAALFTQATGRAAFGLAAPHVAAAYDRLMYGSNSSSSATYQHLKQSGRNPAEGGLRGHFNRGRFSAPSYRLADTKASGGTAGAGQTSQGAHNSSKTSGGASGASQTSQGANNSSNTSGGAQGASASTGSTHNAKASNGNTQSSNNSGTNTSGSSNGGTKP